jgi:hypothetical protein
VNRSGTYKIADIIEIWHNGDGQFRWMPSKILEIKDGKYTVHYGGSQYNVTTVTEDKIRNEARRNPKRKIVPAGRFSRRLFNHIGKRWRVLRRNTTQNGGRKTGYSRSLSPN